MVALLRSFVRRTRKQNVNSLYHHFTTSPMATLHLKAKPNARRNALELAPDGSLTVRLHAPAQDGKANDCLLRFLAEVLAVPRSSLTLLSGHTAPFKKVEVPGLTDAELRGRLAAYPK
jgi:uncharacterized protein